MNDQGVWCMIVGFKYINNAFFYTIFKKHYCPDCNVKLKRIKKSKIVNSKSPEAKYYDFSSPDGYFVGDVKFIWKDFKCPKCEIEIPVDEMRKIERAQRKGYKKS